MNWSSSKYFNPTSDPYLRCRCCGMLDPDCFLIYILNLIRMEFGDIILVNSGTRCTRHNTDVDGAINSYHIALPPRGVKSKAADIHPANGKLDKLYKACNKILVNYHSDRGGLIRYNDFIHVDIRHDQYRSDRRK